MHFSMLGIPISLSFPSPVWRLLAWKQNCRMGKAEARGQEHCATGARRMMSGLIEKTWVMGVGRRCQGVPPYVQGSVRAALDCHRAPQWTLRGDLMPESGIKASELYTSPCLHSQHWSTSVYHQTQVFTRVLGIHTLTCCTLSCP